MGAARAPTGLRAVEVAERPPRVRWLPPVQAGRSPARGAAGSHRGWAAGMEGTQGSNLPRVGGGTPREGSHRCVCVHVRVRVRVRVFVFLVDSAQSIHQSPPQN